MESVAGKLNTMSRLGKWVGIAGLGAYGFGAVSALIDLGKHAQQWGEALASGNHKALAATAMQLTGDGVLLGTNVWAVRHTSKIVQQVMITPSALRALAWAEASLNLLSIAARANLVGLIGTALQLLGEGLYNYFHRDELQKWLEACVWGTGNLNRSLQDDWRALARAVQQPTCELIRDPKKLTCALCYPAYARGNWTADNYSYRSINVNQGRRPQTLVTHDLLLPGTSEARRGLLWGK